MKKQTCIFFFCLFSLFACLPVASQNCMLSFTRQLSSSFLNSIYQDKQGMIWVATENGLNRYDGYSFETFNTNDGLPSDIIINVIQGKDGRIYVGTSRGLCRSTMDNFETITDEKYGAIHQWYVTGLVKTHKGEIIAATSGGGLCKVSADGKFRNITAKIDDAKYCRSIIEDNHGNLWVTTDYKNILCIRSTSTGGKEDYTVIGRYSPKTDGSVAVLCKDNKNNIYVGYLSGGIYYKGANENSFTAIPSTESYSINTIAYHSGKIYAGTDGNGVFILNEGDMSLKPLSLYSPEADISRSKVTSILFDAENNLWLALNQKGVFLQPHQRNQYGYLGHLQFGGGNIGDACVIALYKGSKNNTLYVATDRNGIYGLKDLRQPAVVHYKSPATVLTMTEDNDGRLWVGSYAEGCGWIDSNGSYHRMPFSHGTAAAVFDLQKDNQGRIWIGTLGDGLKCYDPVSEKLTEYRAKVGKREQLINNYILQMEISPDGSMLFVGTSMGLACLDIPSGSWTKVLGTDSILSGQMIRCIKYTNQAGLWAGTSKGAYHYDIATKKLTQYTEEDGLPSNHIAGIEIDNQQRIWISTNKGICSIARQKGKIQRYYTSNGTRSNEFNKGCSYYANDGMLFFGGTLGVTYFNAQKIKPSARKHHVSLTKILVGDKNVRAMMKSGKFTVCDTTINNCRKFEFSHADNNITMHFSTLSYEAAQRISFAYSINDGKWVTMAPGVNTLTLNNLQPGDYNIRIIATEGGVVSEQKEFEIVVHNPWYLTPFMRIIYFLAILSAIGYGIWQFMRYGKQQLKIREHRNAELLQEQKLQFFINISHEIRTPMTLILLPLQQLINDDKHAGRQAIYTSMKRNADRILRLINQIMDLRKIDKEQMRMHMQETEFIEYNQQIIDLFNIQATAKGIDLIFIHSIDKIMVWIDRGNFDKVITNLLSNALKYTNNGGKIIVTVETFEKQVTVKVFDNGESIPDNEIQNIFRRFYQTSSFTNLNKAGTGVGLDLARSIVLMHHGEINVRNVEGVSGNIDRGVEFSVTIPLGCDHLTEEEMIKTDNLAGTNSTEDFPIASVSDDTDENINIDDDMDLDTASTESRRPTIVIVEDEDEIRNYLMTEFSEIYRVLAFPDGSEALPVILRERPQLIISDIMMPRMDGNTLLAKVRNNVNTNHIPIVLLTAKVRDEEKLESLELGADLYITKPFNMDILKRNVANLLKTRKMLRNKYAGKETPQAKIDNIVLESPDERLINRIMDVVNKNLNNSDLNIDMICSEVGISRVHLHRKMKEMTNQTPHDFIRNLRLKQAARLLAMKGQSITEVVYHCGFNSATSFSTMFKKMYGMSPREYQRQHAD